MAEQWGEKSKRSEVEALDGRSCGAGMPGGMLGVGTGVQAWA
jgi:hypothetical protein